MIDREPPGRAVGAQIDQKISRRPEHEAEGEDEDGEREDPERRWRSSAARAAPRIGGGRGPWPARSWRCRPGRARRRWRRRQAGKPITRPGIVVDEESAPPAAPADDDEQQRRKERFRRRFMPRLHSSAMRRRLRPEQARPAPSAMMASEIGRMKKNGPCAASETSRWRSSDSPSTKPSSSAGAVVAAAAPWRRRARRR